MQKRILVVEDSKTYMTMITAALKSAGFDVLGSETIWISRLVNQYHPDLVLMDVTVGGCKGTSAVEALRKQRSGQDIKILLHSAEPMGILSRMAKECGADGYIVKEGAAADSIVKRIRKTLA